jgi:hypothetical protein
MANTRKITNQLLELIENGVLDPQVVLEACLSYMSEADVADMAYSNELIEEEEEEEEEEED